MAVTTINTITHSVLTKSKKKLIMASMRANALVAWMMSNKRTEYEDGGKDITNPIVLGRNSNVTEASYYNTVPINQTDEFDTVTYGWGRVVGSVIISDQERDENKGKQKIFKLLKSKMQILEMSIEEKFAEYLYGAGAGDAPLGLAALIPDDPTTGTLGGIDRAVETQWRTSAYDFSSAALDSTTIVPALDDILLDLTRKNERPNVIFMGRNLLRIYKEATYDKLVVNLGELGTKGKRMADLGFSGVSFDGIPIIYDEDCPVDKAYFINDTYLRMHVMRHVNMRVKKLNSPWNMDASGSRITWQGQFCSWRAHRTHGMMTNS